MGIAALLSEVSPKRRRALLAEAAGAAGPRAPDDAGVRDLVRRAAAILEPRLEVALRHGVLDGVFML